MVAVSANVSVVVSLLAVPVFTYTENNLQGILENQWKYRITQIQWNWSKLPHPQPYIGLH